MSKNKLDEMFEEATTEVVETKDNKKYIYMGAGAVALIAIIIGGLFLLRPKANDDLGPSTNVNGEETSQVNKKDYPITLPTFAYKPFAGPVPLNEAKAYSENLDLQLYLMGVMSQTANPDATSDPAKQVVDGTFNMNYYPTLLEDYEQAFAMFTQRLLNPVYGNWTEGQINGNLDVSVFEDMLTPGFYNSIKEDTSKTPVLFDKNKDNFGLTFLNDDKRFFGEIVKTDDFAGTVEFNEQGAIFTNTYPVKFTALGVNETHTKEGTLTFTMVPDSTSEHRLLISDAKLTVK